MTEHPSGTLAGKSLVNIECKNSLPRAPRAFPARWGKAGVILLVGKRRLIPFLRRALRSLRISRGDALEIWGSCCLELLGKGCFGGEKLWKKWKTGNSF